MSIDLAIPPYEPSVAEPASKDEPRYPSVTLETKEELDLPDDGYVTFKYHKRDVNYSENKDSGETCYRCTLDLQKLQKSEGTESQVDDDEKMTMEDIMEGAK